VAGHQAPERRHEVFLKPADENDRHNKGNKVKPGKCVAEANRAIRDGRMHSEQERWGYFESTARSKC